MIKFLKNLFCEIVKIFKRDTDNIASPKNRKPTKNPNSPKADDSDKMEKPDEPSTNGLQKECNDSKTKPKENNKNESIETNDESQTTDTGEQSVNKRTNDANMSDKSELDNDNNNQNDSEESKEIEGKADESNTKNDEDNTAEDQQPRQSEPDSDTNPTSEKSNHKKTQPSPEQETPESNRKEDRRKSKESKKKDKPTQSDKTKRRSQRQKFERQPWEIGGRRISLGPRGENVEPSDYERAPKLICRENASSSIFDVILIVPENYPVNRVLLNDKELSAGKLPGEYPLLSYSGKLAIDRTDGDKIEISLPKDKPLIFKLRKNWRGDGNSHRYLTIGDFVVIAPKHWTRQGSVPLEDSPCSDSNFQAHFFHIEESNATSEKIGFKECSISLNKYNLNLEGKVLADKSDDGELFVLKPPILTPDHNVTWARVGFEGINDWGDNFKPAERQLSDVLDGKCGRFFIRVYDEEVNLLDSDQFRYSSVLNSVLVNGERYEDDNKFIPPPKGGHKPTTLRFVDINGRNIIPLNKNIEGTVNEDRSVLLNPVPGNDTTEWKIPSGQDYVSVVIGLQRIWWQKKSPEDEPGEWLDKPIELTREEFRELAKKEAVLEFLPKHSKESFRIGFDDKLNIKRKIKDEIALSDFLYHKPIADSSSEESILRILIDDSEIDLILVIADQEVDENCYPMVYGGDGRFRRGKGFSRDEVTRAGMSIKYLRCLNLPFDKRRRSCHNINIKKLKKVKTDA